MRFPITLCTLCLLVTACPGESERRCDDASACPSSQTCIDGTCTDSADPVDSGGAGTDAGTAFDAGTFADGGSGPVDAGHIRVPDAGQPRVADAGRPADAGSSGDGGRFDAGADGGTEPLCGNGELDEGEFCDDGPNNGAYGFCQTNCMANGPRCGDGALDFAFGEVCDDGTNDGAYNGCAACTAFGPRCGDGLVQDTSGEVCDDGVNDGAYNGCAQGCVALGPYCGDNDVDVGGGEVCDDGVNDALGGGCLPGCDEEDTSDGVFGLHVLDVDIDVAPADWEALRNETKRRHTIFGTADCRNEQIENPYNWYTANVTVDGETLLQTGIRKKGHLGSGSTTKPSIKLKFDHVFDAQRYMSMKRIALNNSKSDASYVRMCVSYEAFRQAGYPAPRCTWAHVTVNDVDMGVYVAVEEVKKPYLRRHFADDEGNLYEGTACDWRPEFFGGFEQETNESSDPSRADLQAVMDIVDLPDEEFVAALESLFDMEALYRFWALESLVWHRDGYSGNSNNYFLYADPQNDGRFLFLPWGTDAVMRTNTTAAYPDSVLARGRVFFRLYGYAPTRALYYDALDTILAESWDADSLIAVVDAMEAPLLAASLPTQQAAFTADAAFIRNYLGGRQAEVEAAYAGGFPDWTAGMRTKPCNEEVGSVTVTFDTAWGTLGDPIFSSGTGTVQMSIDGSDITTFANIGVRSGVHNNGSRRLQMDARFTGGGGENMRWFFTAVLPDTLWFEETLAVGTHLLYSPPWVLNATERNLDTATNTRASNVGEGLWVFDVVDTADGGAIQGSFTGLVYDRVLY